MRALECAQYILGEFGYGGIAVAVEPTANMNIRIKRLGRPDVVVTGIIARAIKSRLQRPTTPPAAGRGDKISP